MNQNSHNSINNPESLLEKIIQKQEEQEVTNFRVQDLIGQILNSISVKEREVLSRRFSLNGQPRQTLEEIGRHYNITRERIRQIQAAAIKKIHQLQDIQNTLEVFHRIVRRLLGEYGGVLEENHLLDLLLPHDEKKEETSRNASRFIMNYLLVEHIEPIKRSENFLPGWRLPTVSLEFSQGILFELYRFFDTEQRLLKIEELTTKFLQSEFYRQNRDRINSLFELSFISPVSEEQRIKNLISAHLVLSKKLSKNILDEWGYRHWPTAVPKRMADKIYLILRREKKPLHFTEITKAINNARFDKKIAYPATIHNELILDNRFVLVGRGIYALSEWGYTKGTVADVIVDILKKANRPMTRDEIVDEVLKKRIVKRNTVYLALTNKQKFQKEGKYYRLVQ